MSWGIMISRPPDKVDAHDQRMLACDLDQSAKLNIQRVIHGKPKELRATESISFCAFICASGYSIIASIKLIIVAYTVSPPAVRDVRK
jgi:hypothetical protein